MIGWSLAENGNVVIALNNVRYESIAWSPGCIHFTILWNLSTQLNR